MIIRDIVAGISRYCSAGDFVYYIGLYGSVEIAASVPVSLLHLRDKVGESILEEGDVPRPKLNKNGSHK